MMVQSRPQTSKANGRRVAKIYGPRSIRNLCARHFDVGASRGQRSTKPENGSVDPFYEGCTYYRPTI